MRRKQQSTSSLISSAATIAATAFIILSSFEQSGTSSTTSREHLSTSNNPQNNNSKYGPPGGSTYHTRQSIIASVNGDNTATTSTNTHFHASNRVDNGDGMELERYRRNSKPLNERAKNRSSSSNSRSTNNGNAAGPSSSSNSSNSNDDPNNDNNVIIVATIDGTFYGLSKNNGQVIWESNQPDPQRDPQPPSSTSKDFTNKNRQPHGGGNSDNGDNGDNSDHNIHQQQTNGNIENQTTTNNDNQNVIFAPLITTSTTRSSTKSSWKTSAVPSIDGRVFLTLGRPGQQLNKGDTSNHRHHHRNNNKQKQSRKDLVHYAIADTTITTSMKDLVDRSPFMDSRGRFYVSSKESYAIALDRDTGDVVKVVNGNQYGKDDGDDDIGGNLDDGIDFDFEYDNDEVNDIFKDDNTKAAEDGRNLIWMGRVDYSVTVHDARTGELDVQFSTSEVLSLEDMIRNIDSGGNSSRNNGNGPNDQRDDVLTLPTGEEDGNFFHIDGDKQHGTNSLHESKIVTTPGGKVALCDEQSGKVMWIADDTFKTPVAFALESSSGSSLGVQVVPDAPNTNSFSKEYLSSKLEEDDINDGGLFGDNPNHAMGGTVFGALETGQLFALPLGGQLSSPNQRLLNGLPQISAGSNNKLMDKLPILSGRDDEWDRQDEGKSGRDDYAVALKNHFCERKSSNYHQCLLHHYKIFMTPDENIDIGSFIYHPEPQQQSRFSFFLKLMTSWIPPAVALAFVVAFELGRREKLRQESNDESSKSLELSTPSQLNNTVIDVSDEVLGYGGHGTVVYSGKLEGRAVAVKRMLKAYHASADREISLLIESDGHPNVVRYFLKEVRGDFVYLALELCDMNLQDLITVMSRNRIKSMLHVPQSNDRTNPRIAIDKATKQLLFEIASGVKHIHSLRIVHRDLKPANILLARKHKRKKKNQGQESIFEMFQAQNFVVKISDMGLGKQLVGQSSFGVSTMNNTSVGMSMSRNEGSTIAGAGPGSVGWQAPEVMAHRLSPESPMLQDESSGPEAMLEASPIDASINGRTSRSVDIFSLGCIFYCTILPGCHPFGEWYEREANIMKNCPSTKALENVTLDAADLILSMLHRKPRSRPNAKKICNHPFFWDSLKRLSFFCDLSDRLERLESTGSQTPFEYLIEANAASVVGTAWDTKLEPGLFNNVSKFRSYDPSSVKDCLRLMRNKSHHFDELPQDLKDKIASTREDLVEYFETIFPKLLMHCFRTCRDNLSADDEFTIKYDIPVCIVKRKPAESSNDITNSLGSIILNSNVDSAQSPTVQIPLSSVDQDLSTVEETKSQVLAPVDVVIWENSAAASTYQCRGWMRSEEEWIRGSKKVRKPDPVLVRCAQDNKYRTRLCNHWDVSQGTFCPMRKKHKCDFAHGPVELRVKEGKRNRWGKLVDSKGNNSNSQASGGEDTYGAARSIEIARKEEGKWSTGGKQHKRGRKKTGKVQS